MFRGTTPTFTLTFSDEHLDFSDARSIAVTISDRSQHCIVEITESDLTIETNSLSFSLSQEQTLSLPEGNLLVQVNWTYDQGNVVKRACSDVAQIDFRRNLKEEVME